ncbi:hypothetical protein ONA91_37520 [Micromonospora sp. DR5-3]|uniref:hypothetical protein n=1 Tax=unclassified Micromonospora TaxID=2617518 RepID=UPI0011D8055F|nr:MULTISPECIES: hypothetical protein [unclassified Micromonospora]MCW3820146.1 hypothetical protein [Micromonospora sp. DR5-3]TYC19042.1 hypothetical protein FXF52_38810 [Micromonospora sp. MP36]
MAKNVQDRRGGWRRAKIVGLLAAAATVGTLVSASPAFASTGTTTVCSKGNYGSQLVFVDRGGFATFVVSPGHCSSVHFGKYSSERVNVYGYKSGAKVFLGYAFINDWKTSTFNTYGSIPGSPYFKLSVS